MRGSRRGERTIDKDVNSGGAKLTRRVLRCLVSLGFTVERSDRVDVQRGAAVVSNQELLRLFELVMPEVVRREAAGKPIPVHVKA